MEFMRHARQSCRGVMLACLFVPMGALADAKQDLMEKLASLKSLQASFSQTILDEEQNALQSSTGELSLAQPNKALWHVQSPDESMIISNGENIWFYDPFIEQVTIFDYQTSVVDTPILLLTSTDDALWQKYDITSTASETYVVTSKEQQSQVVSLTLNFNGQELVGFALLDATGQRSVVTLSNVRKIIK